VAVTHATGSAVVVSCHGTVERVEDIPAFVRNIRRGRDAPVEVVQEVRQRFEAIGGSPLMRVTRRQAAALERRLGVPVRAAARLWDPYPAAVIDALRREGITAVASLPLAPQSVHVYNAVVHEAARAAEMDFVGAPAWGLEPKLIAAFVEAIEQAARGLEPDAPVVLTAHSLPRSVIAAGDPYERDFRAMAAAVERALRARGRSTAPMEVAFQSQGMGGGEWIGPSLEDVMQQLAAWGARELIVAPIGFVSEHVETLYDVDVGAVGEAKRLGFHRVARMPAMDVRPLFIDALEVVARALLDVLAERRSAPA
jgi:ferrochelatase